VANASQALTKHILHRGHVFLTRRDGLRSGISLLKFESSRVLWEVGGEIFFLGNRVRDRAAGRGLL
jgi:hypothetical protein